MGGQKMASPAGQPLGRWKGGWFSPSAVWCLPDSSLRRKLPAWSGCVVVAPALRAGFNGTSRRGKPHTTPNQGSHPLVELEQLLGVSPVRVSPLSSGSGFRIREPLGVLTWSSETPSRGLE